ncbi:hypothetical protein KAI87_08360, partial [Myxococcota bacterium]|nr:hypothetical protein [Myxococcota bacterium]
MIISLRKISLLLAFLIFASVPLTPHTAHARRKRSKKKAAPKSQVIKIAVLELSALGMTNAMRRNLDLLLRNSIATLPDVQIIKPVEIQMTLGMKKNKDIRDCG